MEERYIIWRDSYTGALDFYVMKKMFAKGKIEGWRFLKDAIRQAAQAEAETIITAVME